MGLLTALGYAGGLVEWMEQAPRPSPLAPRALHGASPTMSASAGLLDALADQTVGGLFRLWVVIVAVCGVAYWCLAWFPGHVLETAGATVRPDVAGFLSALYFSAVTATSVGYGDIVPIGSARLVAIVESIAGLVIFGCLVSKFVSRR